MIFKKSDDLNFGNSFYFVFPDLNFLNHIFISSSFVTTALFSSLL
jgi:hypothetical protein